MRDIMLFQMFVMACGTTAFIATLRFVARYLELRRRTPPAEVPSGLQERLDRIEQAVYTTAVEVERIAEGNRFMAKLLSERAGGIPIKEPERVVTPH
jgi:hypothetical protein